MFKLLKNEITLLFLSPKFYLSILLSSVQFIFYCNMLIKFSNYLNEPLNILDGFIYCSSTTGTMMLSFFALLFVFSDLPYNKSNLMFEIIRMTKRKWIILKLLYIVSTIIIYYLIIFLITVLFTAENSFISNIWSDPIYTLTANRNIGQNFGNLYLDNFKILIQWSPIAVTAISFSLTVAYSALMIIILLICNMKFGKGIGISIVVSLQVLGYAIILFFHRHQQWSLLNHSILARHTINGDYVAGGSPLISHSVIIFAVLIVLFIVLSLVSVKKFDIDKI